MILYLLGVDNSSNYEGSLNNMDAKKICAAWTKKIQSVGLNCSNHN